VRLEANRATVARDLALEQEAQLGRSSTNIDLVDDVIELKDRENSQLVSSAPSAPGSASGLVADVVIAAAAPNDTRSTALALSPNDRPTAASNADGSLGVTARATLQFYVPYLPWMWLIGTPVTFALLATGIVGTRRLRIASRPIHDGPLTDLLAQLVVSLRIGQRIGLAVCDRIATPVLIGILRPIILLPPAALTGWSPDEIEMVLLHELAHVRRWDNLINLAQRIIESLLFFHPVVWWVSAWIRREREACCDAIVIGRTNRPHAYAELLLALAAQMPRSVLFQPAASSAMASGPLRIRIRRILQLEDDPMLVSGKSFVIALASLVVAATVAVLYLPAIGQAEESTTEGAESTEVETAEAGNESPESPKHADKQERLSDAHFPTPHDFMTSVKALELLGLKVAPASDAEIEQVRPHGYRGGLKLLEFEHFPHLKDPFIFTEFGSRAISTGVTSFKDLQRALDAVAAKPGDGRFVISGVAKGGSKFTYQGRMRAGGRADDTAVEAEEVTTESTEAAEESEAATTAAAAPSNHEPNERQVIATFPVKILDTAPGEFLKAVDEARAKGLYVDLVEQDNQLSLVVVPSPTEADWPNLLVDRPKKDRIIAETAWRRLGLKLVPASLLEILDYSLRAIGGPVKILGGNVPKRMALPAYLRKIGNDEIYSFDRLDAWLNSDYGKFGKRIVPVKVYAIANGKDYLFDAQPFRDASPAPSTAVGPARGIPSRSSLVSQGPAQQPLRFPSLEDQKLADLAYKRLGLELEAIGDEDLQRVKALGYDSGLRITNGPSGMVAGGILVGLHAWPTRSLEDVAEVLRRDDLAELTPLKYYVVQQEGMGGVRVAGRHKDIVVTGRIPVTLPFKPPQFPWESDSAASDTKPPSQPVAPNELPAAKAKEPSGKQGSPPSTRRPAASPDPSAAAPSADVSTAIVDAMSAAGIDPKTGPVQVEMIPHEGGSAVVVRGATKPDSDVPSYELPSAADEDAVPTRPGGEIPGATASPPKEQDPSETQTRPRTILAPTKPNLRYEDKTFEEWRDAWRTELSIEKRLEVVKALAAFGAAGSNVINYSDILMINAVKIVPKPPHHLEPFDGLLVRVADVSGEQIIGDAFVIDPEGGIDLGREFGRVNVVGMTVEEAHNELRGHLSATLEDPAVSVSLAFSAGAQQIAGEHLVGPDGRVNLGTYGTVYVADMTLDEARWAIQSHLENKLDDPELTVEFFTKEGGTYGKAAAESILEIARQYDWKRDAGPNRLQRGVLAALLGDGTLHVIPARDWFPIMMRHVKAGDKTMQQFAEWVVWDLDELDIDVNSAKESLLELSRSKSSSLRRGAMVALAEIDRQHIDPLIVARLQEMLQSDDAEQVKDALLSLRTAGAPLPFDASALLFHSDEEVRYVARHASRDLHPNQAKSIVQFLMHVLEDAQRGNDHLAAIRALRALGRDATSGYVTFEKLVVDRQQPMPIRIAAAVAAEEIMDDGGLKNRLQKDVMKEYEKRYEPAEFQMEIKQFEYAVKAEQESH
jgi:beta-lactamase regulating signal transducer with metallopeptidase domain